MSEMQSDESFSHQQNPLTIDKVEDIDRERLFNLALNEESEVNTLMTHYRDRMNGFDREREEWLHKLETVRMSMDQIHKSHWELQKRKEEIAELQRSLNEAKLHLYDERQQMLRLVKENDQLRLKEIEDKKKIVELVAINEPLEQEVVLYKDLKPETLNKYVKNDLSVNRNKEHFEKIVKKTVNMGHGKPVTMTTGTGSTRSVLKTIYLPNEQINGVSAENENLKRQLEQNALATQEQIQDLKEELLMRETDWMVKYESNQQIIRELQEKNQKLEKGNVDVSQDYFALRLKSNQHEKQLQEENELMRLKNAALANKLKIRDKSAQLEAKTHKEFNEKKSGEYANRFRKEIKKKEEDYLIIKEQYAQVQRIYMEKVKELEENLSKLADKYNNLDQRRVLEIEGFKTEVKNLKKGFERFVQTGYQERRAAAEEAGEVSAATDEEEMELIKKQFADLEKRVEAAKRSKR